MSAENLLSIAGGCLHFCNKCKGLFGSTDDHLKHHMVCMGNPFKSSSMYFACERKIYLQLFQSEDFQSDGSFNQLNISKDDSFINHVVKIRMPQDVIDPSVFLRTNASSSLQPSLQDSRFILDTNNLDTDVNKDFDVLHNSKQRFSESIEPDQLRNIINKNIDYLKSDSIPALTSHSSKELPFPHSQSEPRLLSPIEKHFLPDLPKSRVQSPFEKCVNYLQEMGGGYQTGSLAYASNQSIPFSCNLSTDLLGGLASTHDENQQSLLTSIDEFPTLQYLDLAKKDLLFGQSTSMNQMNTKDPFLINATVKTDRPLTTGQRYPAQSSKSCDDLQTSPTFQLQDGNYFNFPSTLDEPTQLDYLDLATLDFLTNPSSFSTYGVGMFRDRYLSDRDDIYSECNLLFNEQNNYSSENVERSEKQSLEDNVKFTKNKIKRMSLKKVKRGIERKSKQSGVKKSSAVSRDKQNIDKETKNPSLTLPVAPRTFPDKKRFKRTYSAEYGSVTTSPFTRKRKLMSSHETLNFRISPEEKRRVKTERKFNESQRLCQSNTILNVKDSLVGYTEEEKESMTAVFGQLGCIIVKKQKVNSKSDSVPEQIITEVPTGLGEKVFVLDGKNLQTCENSTITGSENVPVVSSATALGNNSENVKSVLKLKCRYCSFKTTNVSEFKDHKLKHEQQTEASSSMLNEENKITEVCNDKTAIYTTNSSQLSHTLDSVSNRISDCGMFSTESFLDNDSTGVEFSGKIIDNIVENSLKDDRTAKESDTLSESLISICEQSIHEMSADDQTVRAVSDYIDETIDTLKASESKPTVVDHSEELDKFSASVSNSTDEILYNTDEASIAYKQEDDFQKRAYKSGIGSTEELSNPNFDMLSLRLEDGISKFNENIASQNMEVKLSHNVDHFDLARTSSPIFSTVQTDYNDACISTKAPHVSAEFGSCYPVEQKIGVQMDSNSIIVLSHETPAYGCPTVCNALTQESAVSLFPEELQATRTEVEKVSPEVADEQQVASHVFSQQVLADMISEADDNFSKDSWTNIVSKPLVSKATLESELDDMRPYLTTSCKIVTFSEPANIQEDRSTLVKSYHSPVTVSTVFSQEIPTAFVPIPLNNSDPKLDEETELNMESGRLTHEVNLTPNELAIEFQNDVESGSLIPNQYENDDNPSFEIARSSHCYSIADNKISDSVSNVTDVHLATNPDEYIVGDETGVITDHLEYACKFSEIATASRLESDEQSLVIRPQTNKVTDELDKFDVTFKENIHTIELVEVNPTVEQQKDYEETAGRNHENCSKERMYESVEDVDLDKQRMENEIESKNTLTLLHETASSHSSRAEIDHSYGINSRCKHTSGRSHTAAGCHDNDTCKTDDQTLSCDYCGYRTAKKSALKAHMVKHEGVQLLCSVPQCGYKTVHQRCLNTHLLRHNGGKQLLCDQCAFTTTDAHSLKRHMQLKHLMLSRFKCPDCDRLSMSRDDIVKHYRNAHLQQKLYACNQCEYKTGYTHLLKFHLMAHAGIRPYKCSACEYQVNNVNKVTRHIKTRHRDQVGVTCQKLDLDFEVDAKQFQCEEKICDKKEINVIELTEDQIREITEMKLAKQAKSQKEKLKTDIPVFNPKRHQPQKMVSLLENRTKSVETLEHEYHREADSHSAELNVTDLSLIQANINNRNCNTFGVKTNDNFQCKMLKTYGSVEEVLQTNLSTDSLCKDQRVINTNSSRVENLLDNEYQCSMCDFLLKSHEDIAQHLLVCKMETNKTV